MTVEGWRLLCFRRSRDAAACRSCGSACGSVRRAARWRDDWPGDLPSPGNAWPRPAGAGPRRTAGRNGARAGACPWDARGWCRPWLSRLVTKVSSFALVRWAFDGRGCFPTQEGSIASGMESTKKSCARDYVSPKSGLGAQTRAGRPRPHKLLRCHDLCLARGLELEGVGRQILIDLDV